MPAFVGEDLGGLCRETTDRGSKLLLVELAPSSLQRLLPPLAVVYEFFENAELDDVLEAWSKPASPDGDVEVSRLPVHEATAVEHALQCIRLAVEVDVCLSDQASRVLAAGFKKNKVLREVSLQFL